MTAINVYETHSNNTWHGVSDVALYCEWGVHFDEEGYGSDSYTGGNTWYTLSATEWTYLLMLRNNRDNLKGYGWIQPSGSSTTVPGLILLPDNWLLPTGWSFTPGTTANTYTKAQWRIMEAAGAVFLPAAGRRSGKQFLG